MIINALSVLLPVLFVMGLGYFAGRAKKFDADQVQGLNELVIVYAMPALMFVGTVSTTRSHMLSTGHFLAGILVAFVGVFVSVLLFSLFVLHHSLGEAALQANLLSYPSVAFMGIPIFRGLFGAASILSIASAAVIASLTIVPMTIVLLEVHKARSASGEAHRMGELVGHGLISSVRQPMVWAPLLGALLVLLDVSVPEVIDNMLKLIGSTTSGASLFLAGLIIAAYKVRLDVEILGNVLIKMLGQPLIMALLVTAFAIANPLGREAIILCAIPSAVFAPLLAPRYHVYETESASTLVLTSLTMIVTLPIAIVLTGA